MNKPQSIDDPNRFAFGANWTNFLKLLNDERIQESEAAIKALLMVDRLDGKTFLDIGSGSGLSSLAARRLGAKIVSFDFDPQSVACTTELRRRYFPDDPDWIVKSGSALDAQLLETLGKFDVVYSWGVLHHTGAMWLGIENSLQRVAPNGKLFIAIYNDQGIKSHLWWLIKWFYNKLPWPLNKIYGYSLGFLVNLLNILRYTIRLKPMAAIRPLIRKNHRGMSVRYDLLDWMGGFPFEFATYELLENYMSVRGFKLINGKRATSLGCHEMVFERKP
ncbi:MAG: class I SAM-dependent methyltransferase [Pirellulaceae bacterium]